MKLLNPVLKLLTCPKHVLFVRHAMTCHTPFKEGPLSLRKSKKFGFVRKKIPIARFLHETLYFCQI